MTINQIYNTLIKLLGTRGFRCTRCEPRIRGSLSDRIIDMKTKYEHIQHLWETCKYFKEVVGLSDSEIVERIYQMVLKAINNQQPIQTLEEFYDKFC